MAREERILRLRDEGLHWRVLENETVVLDTTGSRYLTINATGTLLWPLLARGATTAQLIEALRDTWPIPEDAAARDVAEYCALLDAEGLLRP